LPANAYGTMVNSMLKEMNSNRDHVWIQVFKLQSKIDALEDEVGEND